MLLIDALDEAREADGTRNRLLELVADRFAELPPWVGLVVTSRPERDIRAKLYLGPDHDKGMYGSQSPGPCAWPARTAELCGAAAAAPAALLLRA